MTKEKKIIIGVIGLMLMAVVGIMLWQPILFRYLMYIELSCYCAYRFVEIWVLAPKLKKLASLEWWIYIVLVYVIIMQENIDLKETGTATIVSIGFVLFLLRMLVVYFQTNNCKEEIYISAMYIFILFYFAIVNSENYIGFWVFKILTVLFIFSMTKIINHTKRFWGVIIMLCVYLIMIAVSGALSSNFVSSLSVEAETSFYVAIRNLYTLPDISEVSSRKEMWDLIISFLLCRVTDAVLIGSLVNIFNEKELGWFEKRKKDEKENVEQKEIICINLFMFK